MQCIVNGQHDFDVQEGRLNGEPVELDMVTTGPDSYHILRNGKGYRAELVSLEAEEKTLTWRINGNLYSVQVKDHFDALLDKLGLSAMAGAKAQDIKAPMPGLVLDVMVESGQAVSKGDAVLILEAMKMENVLKAQADGTVQSVEVAKGDAVEKNTVLIKMG